MQLKRLFPIFLIVFTNILGGGVILPILPLYAQGEFAGSVVQVTLLNSLFFAAQFVAAPRLGHLSDRIGRRPVLLISQAGTILAFILFIFAGPLGRQIDGLGIALPVTGGMLMLYIARLLDGITGGNITTAQAYISDVSTPENRAQSLGLLHAAFGLGFIFGPSFGGILSSYGSVMPFVGAAIITTITFMLTLVMLKESLPPERRTSAHERHTTHVPLRTLLGERALVNILLIGFFSTLAFAALQSTFALFASDVLFPDAPSPERVRLYIGLMLTFLGIVTVITQLGLLRPLVHRFGEQKLIVIGEVSIIIGMLGMGLVRSPLLATLLLSPISFGQGTTEPSLQSLVTRFGTDRTRGRLLGVYQSAKSLALIIGPLLAGSIYQIIDPQSPYLAATALLGIALLFAVMLLRREAPIPLARISEAASQAND